MFKIFQAGHSPTPANLPHARFDYRAQDNQKGEETAGFSKNSPLNMVFVRLSSELGNSKLMKILNLNRWRFPEMGAPLNHPYFLRVFHYKPSILRIHRFRKPPNHLSQCHCDNDGLFSPGLVVKLLTTSSGARPRPVDSPIGLGKLTIGKP